MFIPILGRCLYYKYRFLFSIFIESQPLILSCYSSMLPAFFGDSPCFMMSVLSYITTTTPESDRVLRLSIFSVFVLLTNNLNLIIEPNDYFAYPITSAICLAFEVAAILYVIFLIKEPKSNESVSQSNDMHLTNMGDIPIEENVTNIALSSEPPRRNIFREFFDPMLVLELIKLPYKRRDIYGSLILLLLILCYCLSVGQIDVETKYFNDHDNIAFRLMRFESYITGALLCGLVFSKTWKFSNSIIGIWISVFTAVSRLVYNFAPTTEITTTHYFGGVLDLFAVLRLVPIQSEASTINEGDGKLFSFFGILEPIAIFIYQPIYDAVVFASIESFPNFLLLNIELFYVPNVLIFIACYFLMRRRNSNMAQHNSTENL
ncbi:uncharacterized protein LOC132785196 [Drosophila nasuta]|uniref:uncharacterized protein LOC132785196 n=1 Tax=Drosophila nasuta TaxID=42062 RepID=UPI00295E5A5E|nr:uncharacterized protein LOC132785196 [Drosophila nasuta]